MDKTLYLSSSTDPHRFFVSGFLDASNWMLTSKFDSTIYLQQDNFVVPLPQFTVYFCDPTSLLHPLAFSPRRVTMQYRHNTGTRIYISMPESMKYAYYLQCEQEAPSKLVSALFTQEMTDYDVGYRCGLFAADAINEQSWLEYLAHQTERRNEVGINEG